MRSHRCEERTSNVEGGRPAAPGGSAKEKEREGRDREEELYAGTGAREKHRAGISTERQGSVRELQGWQRSR